MSYSACREIPSSLRLCCLGSPVLESLWRAPVSYRPRDFCYHFFCLALQLHIWHLDSLVAALASLIPKVLGIERFALCPFCLSNAACHVMFVRHVCQTPQAAGDR